jgi:retinol dehydrogenase-12
MTDESSNAARKSALVTGANTGIGFAVARALAQSAAHVVLACRDQDRGHQAMATINKEFPDASLELLLVDLSSQQSIRSASTNFLARHPSLDVLVNNAGIGLKTREESVDGIEMTFATNVLAYFLLTNLLLAALRKAPAGRIVNVASELAGGLDLSDLEFKRRGYEASAAYSQSKQANRMLTWALARRLADSKLTANAMSPGPVDTRLLRTFAPNMKGKTTTEGADTIVWLATSSEVDGRTGRFWVDRHEKPCRFHNRQDEERLWLICEQLTSPGHPGS